MNMRVAQVMFELDRKAQAAQRAVERMNQELLATGAHALYVGDLSKETKVHLESLTTSLNSVIAAAATVGLLAIKEG